MDKYLNFAQLLQGLNDGFFHNDLSEKFKALVVAMQNGVQDHGGKQTGKMTITLDMTLDGGVFEIKADVKVKEPPPPTLGKSIFWATPDNYLTKSNPRQSKLPFDDVTPIRREVT